VQEINRIQNEIEIIDNKSTPEDYKGVLKLYENFIQDLCIKLRKILLNKHNLFISNPVFIVNYSYALDILSNKNIWIEALRLYNQVKYLIPIKDINYDMIKKMSHICNSLLADRFFNTQD